MSLKLKSCSVREAVMFGGTATQTFFRGPALLELDDSLRAVIVTPTSAAGKDAIYIPLENVKCFTVWTESMAQAADILIASKDAEDLATKAKSGSAQRRSALGVTKFVKDETGNIVEKQV